MAFREFSTKLPIKLRNTHIAEEPVLTPLYPNAPNGGDMTQGGRGQQLAARVPPIESNPSRDTQKSRGGDGRKSRDGQHSRGKSRDGSYFTC